MHKLIKSGPSRLAGFATLAALTASYSGVAEANTPFIEHFSKVSTIASTIPANGDLNPYGVAIVPKSIGDLKKGNILVSNFNNSENLQGQGTTIVQITPKGVMSTFATIDAATLPGACPGGVGLTTALTVLKRGWVIVGSLPTTGPDAAFSGAGCLIVLDSNGRPVRTIAGPNNEINGPWDLASFDRDDQATLFVTNVLNGNVTSRGGSVVNAGTVVRLHLNVPQPDTLNLGGDGLGGPTVTDARIIGSGFSEKTDPAALIIGPTGLAFDPKTRVLYVADTINNRISAIPNALKRRHTAYAGEDVTANGNLTQPLGLALAPNGDILTVNGGDGNSVETSPEGTQLETFELIPNGGGALFGLAVAHHEKGIYFVNDNNNTLMLFH